MSIRLRAAASLRAAERKSSSDSTTYPRAASGLTCALALATLGFSGAVAAQQTRPTSASPPPAGASSSSEPTATLQEVTVTGTRIKRTSTYSTPTPTTVIDTQTMQNQGIINVGQALSLVPSNDQEFSPTAAPASPFYAGQSIADLRGLNGFFNTRTLTMVDTHRIVPTAVTGSFDLNMLPQILVERIDTVTGGASAAYGSGAIAGVVNVILNRDLNGGKFDADLYNTHYNDARDRHVGFAYGQGLFHNRAHFVIGAEWEKQDPAFCDGRPWCEANFGPYTTAYSPQFVPLSQNGGNIRANAQNVNGVLGLAAFNPATFADNGTFPGAPLYSASDSGLGLIPYAGNAAVGGGGNFAPGGQGTPVNRYTVLVAPVTRGVVTGLFTFKLPAHVKMDVDFNWGKTELNNPEAPAVNNITNSVIGLDNPYLPAGASALVNPTATGPYYLGKDWNQQIPNAELNDTTLTRVTTDFSGPIDNPFNGDSTSWTWDSFFEYGLVKSRQNEPTNFHANEASMALDAVTGPNGQPECRITAALAAHPNDPQAALAAALASARAAYPGPNFALPVYLESYANSQGVTLPPNPLTGLNLVQTEALLGQNCVPVNPFGTTPLSPAQIGYLTGSLSLKMRQTQTDFTANATGNFFHGIGAGPFSIAFGYEWRQEVVNNSFANCQQATVLCLSQTTDFNVQFGNGYGVDTTVNEGYLELNFPLLKDIPFAHRLGIDIAGRVSSYDNKTLFGVQIPKGSFTHLFATWKGTLNYEPFQGLRLRATESRDERAPNARDIGYSQIFVAGSLFGSCASAIGTVRAPCNINLTGNPRLSPELSNTTTVGVVFTPPQLPGFQFSADWWKIHLFDGIEGGNIGISTAACGFGQGAAACPGFTFNNFSYNAAGQACGAGVATASPGGVDCTGVTTYTGAAAYQLGNVANILDMTAPAFNGANYDTRGIDFSLNYIVALPDNSTLAVRALTTWVGQQSYQPFKGGPVVSLLGQTGNNSSFIGLGDFQSAPRWRGNLSVTWAKGPWTITPNVTWIGQGTLNNEALSCTKAQLADTSNPCNWVYTGYTNVPAQYSRAAAYLQSVNSNIGGVDILPMGMKNHVPFYAIVGLNATYTFRNILKGLQVYGQVNNLFNRTPPRTAGTPGTATNFNGSPYTSNPVYFDQLGQAYRVGFRVRF